MKTIKQIGSYALALLLTIIAIIGAVIIALNNLNSSLQSTSTNLSSEVALVSANLTSDPIISTSKLCNYKTTISSDLTYTDGYVSGATVAYSGSGNCIDSKLAAAFSDSTKGTAIVVFPTTIEGYDCKNDFSGYHTITAIVDVVDYGLFNNYNPPMQLVFDVNNYFPLYANVDNVDASLNLAPSSNESLLELYTSQGEFYPTSFDLMYNQSTVIATPDESYPELFNQATCFISWKDVDDATINGITYDHKQTVLTNIESKVTTLNEELNTMTSSITTVDENGDSGGGAYPYGNDLLTYDYSAITSAITNIDALFAVVDGKASADYFRYKVDYATQANSYGTALKVSYGDNFVYNQNDAAEQLSADINTTLAFLEGDPLAAFNDQECQLTIDVNVDIESTIDAETGTTTTYSHQSTVLSNNEGNCPENILAVALDKIESTVEDGITTTNVNVMTLPYTVGGDTFNSCGDFFNREGVAPAHFIEININVSTNNEAITDFPQHTMNIYFVHEELTQDIEGNWVYNTSYNDKSVPPNGNVSLETTIAKIDGYNYVLIKDINDQLIYGETVITNDDSICYYWDNTPFE